jgi:hypothetical protein
MFLLRLLLLLLLKVFAQIQKNLKNRHASHLEGVLRADGHLQHEGLGTQVADHHVPAAAKAAAADSVGDPTLCMSRDTHTHAVGVVYALPAAGCAQQEMTAQYMQLDQHSMPRK